MTKKIYFENLDGLRFLCFLSIFFFHSFQTDYIPIKSTGIYQLVKRDLFGNGFLGVNFFFVLSGFLITYLLIEEKKLNGQIDILNFWIRRILRIWPLFYLCVFFGFVIFPALKTAFGEQPNETATIGYYLTFTNNFELDIKGAPDASILAVLWSIAVEEQFYLVWPILLYFSPIKNYHLIFIIIIVVSSIFRTLNLNYNHYDHHTLSNIGDMAVGALGAWLILTKEKFKEKIMNLHSVFILSFYVSFLFIFIFRDELLSSKNFVIEVVERPITALIILFIILEQCFSKKSLFKMSDFKLISNLGKISYGLYCLHFIAILIVTTLTKKLLINTETWQVLVFEPSFALILAVIISLISYHFYEKPFLKLKDRFAYIKKT